MFQIKAFSSPFFQRATHFVSKWLEAMGRKIPKLNVSRNIDFSLGPLWNVAAHMKVTGDKKKITGLVFAR